MPGGAVRLPGDGRALRIVGAQMLNACMEETRKAAEEALRAREAEARLLAERLQVSPRTVHPEWLTFDEPITELAAELHKADGPTHMAVILDKGSSSFRNEMYDQYKAHRPPAPEEEKPKQVEHHHGHGGHH